MLLLVQLKPNSVEQCLKAKLCSIFTSFLVQFNAFISRELIEDFLLFFDQYRRPAGWGGVGGSYRHDPGHPMDELTEHLQLISQDLILATTRTIQNPPLLETSTT